MRSWQDAPEVDISPLQQLDLQPVVARALVRRGNSSPSAARAFLDPLHVPLASPSELPGMSTAVERILTAVDRHESIWIWGDFDVDGQTATTILVQALSALGATPGYHLPLRSRDGHGVHTQGLASLIESGAQLIVTCDTGINANAAAEYARARGTDLVITDHHEPGSELPTAAAVVNPRLLAPDHPLANLAGVGVAYELATALLASRGMRPDFLLDLVALGLIADVALLKGDTRPLTQRGIEALRATPRIGLRALSEFSKTDLAALTEETIGFEIAPRLNAVGRLSDASQAVELLLTQDPVRAQVLATQIEGLNIRRRLLTEQVYHAAEEQLHNDPSLLTRPLLTLMHPSWPGGVLGIVASKLVEEYQKPALVLSAADDGSIRGSARSIEGLDVTAAIAACAPDLEGFGGHPMAAGVSLSADKFEGFQRHLEKAVEKMMAEAQFPGQILAIDEGLTLDRLSLELADELAPLAPFGAGNPEVIFAAPGLHLISARPLGRDGKHQRLVVSDQDANTLEVLWWNSSPDDLPRGKFDLACTVRATTYGGERQLRVELRDLRSAEEVAPEVVDVAPEIVDLRHHPSADALPASCLIWAEGMEKAKGNDRLHLRVTEALVVWTTPPSRAHLRAALEVTKPRRIYLLGRAPSPDQVDTFLSKLAGLAKYSLNQHAGIASVSAMASALADRELTVRLGLEWLAAGGHLRIEGDGDEIRLLAGETTPDKEMQAELQAGVKSLLEETAAYREYFARAAAESLLRR